MQRLRFLRAVALEQLRANVRQNLDRYRSEASFEELEQDPSTYFSLDIRADEATLRSLDAGSGSESDARNSIATYKALTNLTPYDARDERMWAYLTHTHCLQYARERWPIPDDDDRAVKHIHAHFFAKTDRQIERDNAVSRLWWISRLCSQVQDMKLEEAIEVLLFRTDARAQIIERPTMSQNPKVFTAILRALKPYVPSGGGLIERSNNREFLQRINEIGGYRLLDILPDKELEEVISNAASHTTSQQFASRNS